MVGEGQGEGEEEEELEWLSNKDAFPSVDTMAAEVESAAPGAPARAAVGPRTRVCGGAGGDCSVEPGALLSRPRQAAAAAADAGAAAPVHPLRRG